jgi:serine protease
MSRLRSRLLPLVVAIAAALVYQSSGRTQVPPRFEKRVGVGLPAIDQNFTEVSRRAPGSPDLPRRDALGRTLRADRVGRAGGRYAPGRLVVKFRDGVSADARRAALAAAAPAAAIGARPSFADFDVATADPSVDVEAVADALMRRPEVEYAQAAYRWSTRFTPNDPYYTQLQWNFPLIQVDRAWDIQPAAGSTMTVAIIDSGVAYQSATITADIPAFTQDGVDYPALGTVTIPYGAATQLAHFRDPYDFIWDDAFPLDFDGHGTHVSGTVGQTTNDGLGTAGIAFNVTIMPVKVVDSFWDDLFGAPNAGTDDVVARGIRYAADHGAKVLNMSIGRNGPPAPVVEDAVRYAVSKGAFVAIAGGNGYEDGNPLEQLADIASRVDGAVSVSAVDRSKNHAYYSTTGSYIEMAAPGGGGGAEDSGYVWQQTFNYNFTDTYLRPPADYEAPRFDMFAYVGYIGTSMATPHVAAVAAMIMQQGITDPAAVEAVLERFATDLGTEGRDDIYGYGLVNARAVLRGLGVAK